MTYDEIVAAMPRLREALRPVAFRQAAKTGASGEDLLQDALAEFLDRHELIPPGEAMLRYCRRAVCNLANMKYRRRSVRPKEVSVEDGVWDYITEPVAAGQETSVMARQALEAIERMPEETRTLIYDVAVQRVPLAEMAGRLGVPIGTVKSRVSRALAALRETLEAEAPARGCPGM